MTRKKRSLSNDDLRTVAVACGGVALLMAIAVFLAPQNIVVSSTSSNSNVAAAGDFRDHGSTNNNADSTSQTPVDNDPLRAAAKTDTSWLQSRTLTTGWEQPNFDASNWRNAVGEGGLNNNCDPSSIVCRFTGGAFNGVQDFPADTPAQWIWYKDSRSSGDSETVYFRKKFVASNTGARIYIAADNIYTAYLDGHVISTGNDWHQAHYVDVSLTPGKTYTLAASVRNTGGSGGLLLEVDQTPWLNLQVNSLSGGNTTVNWSSQYASDCTVTGPGVSATTAAGQKSFQLSSSQFPVTYTMRCTTPRTEQKQVVLDRPNNWFSTYGGLKSWGNDTNQGAYQDTIRVTIGTYMETTHGGRDGNEHQIVKYQYGMGPNPNVVKNGWPAPLGCQIVNDSSEVPCWNFPKSFPAGSADPQRYGILSAFQSSAPSNGTMSYFTARLTNDGGRYHPEAWDTPGTTWVPNVTPTPRLDVPVGQPVTLEWSCVPVQHEWFEDNCSWFGASDCSKDRPIKLFTSAQGTNFSTGGANRGYVTVTPPAGGAIYTLTCTGQSTGAPYAAPGVSIAINRDPNNGGEPTLTIVPLLNNVPLTSHVQIGAPVVLHATYAAAQNDTLTGANIYGGVNDRNTAACQGSPLGCPTPVYTNGNKNATVDFAFTPTMAGTYTFYPVARTVALNANYVNYGNVSAQVVVDCPPSQPSCPQVPPQCDAGSVVIDGVCTSCPSGQTLINGVCAPCPSGQVDGAGMCVPCQAGYEAQNGSCVALGVINSFTAEPPRVRKGNSVTFTWQVSNMATCGITGTDGSRPAPYTAANASPGTHTASSVVQQATNYTLLCTDKLGHTYTQSRLVNLIPAFEEI
jgi:hypothetical protein